MKFLLENESDTLALGALLAQNLPDKGLVFLTGTLGAGKTTLVRGFLMARGHVGSTKSPTYTLVEPYLVKGKNIYHFDLYRLGDPEELEYMGIRDYLAESATCLIEWPQQGEGFLPQPDLSVHLQYNDENRCVWIEAKEQEFSLLLNHQLKKRFNTL